MPLSFNERLMPIFRMIRTITTQEEVEIEARNADEAMFLAIDDDEEINILSSNDSDYTVDPTTIYEVKEP